MNRRLVIISTTGCLHYSTWTGRTACGAFWADGRPQVLADLDGLPDGAMCRRCLDRDPLARLDRHLLARILEAA